MVRVNKSAIDGWSKCINDMNNTSVDRGRQKQKHKVRVGWQRIGIGWQNKPYDLRKRERKKDKHCHDLLLPHVIRSDGHWKCRLSGDLDEPLPNIYKPEADAGREHFQILPSVPRCGFSPTKHCGFDSVLPSVLHSCYQIPFISHKRTAHTPGKSCKLLARAHVQSKQTRTHARMHARHACPNGILDTWKVKQR